MSWRDLRAAVARCTLQPSFLEHLRSGREPSGLSGDERAALLAVDPTLLLGRKHEHHKLVWSASDRFAATIALTEAFDWTAAMCTDAVWHEVAARGVAARAFGRRILASKPRHPLRDAMYAIEVALLEASLLPPHRATGKRTIRGPGCVVLTLPGGAWDAFAKRLDDPWSAPLGGRDWHPALRPGTDRVAVWRGDVIDVDAVHAALLADPGPVHPAARFARAASEGSQEAVDSAFDNLMNWGALAWCP